MTAEEQQAVYEKLQAAHAAYQELTEEQKAKITGAEKLDNLFSFFAGKTNALINGVTYLDENGSEQTADNVTEVASGMTAWSDGWYVVNGSVTIDSRVAVSGEVHLILADGASLIVHDDINVAEGNSFTVYAQSTGAAMGVLTAKDKTGNEAGIGGGNWRLQALSLSTAARSPQPAILEQDRRRISWFWWHGHHQRWHCHCNRRK